MSRCVKKILVITKYRFIGDTLTAIPTIRAAKKHWPDAELTLLSGARACELLQNSPFVDHFIEFDPYRTSDQGLKQYLMLIARLRRERFDIALVLNRSFHSALTAALGGAKARAGWSGFEGRDFLLTASCEYGKELPEIDCFLDVFRISSKTEPPERFLELWLTPNEVLESSAILPSGGTLTGLQPGATHGYKQWPVQHFVDLAEQLIELDPIRQIVLIGGREEKPISDAFNARATDRLRERTVDTVGTLSLRMTLGVVSQLDQFVGNDTAIRHAAVALDTPSIGIFGPTSCTKWGNADPPRHNVVSSVTGKMEDVGVDEVLKALLTMLPSQKLMKGSRHSSNALNVPSVGV